MKKIKSVLSGFLLRLYLKMKSVHEMRVFNQLLEQLGTAGKNISFTYPFMVKNPQYIHIGDNCFALQNLRIEAWDTFAGARFNPSIRIGSGVTFNTDCHIGCIHRVEIGNHVLIASRVYISDHSHGEVSAAALSLPPGERPLVSKGPIVIHDNVWIGEGVCILPGVTIGRNAIIGANAVVTKDIPENSVAAGIPARIIKTLIE